MPVRSLAMASVRSFALLLHVLELAADLGQLLLGAQVDAAKPFALGLELHDLLFDLVRAREGWHPRC